MSANCSHAKLFSGTSGGYTVPPSHCLWVHDANPLHSNARTKWNDSVHERFSEEEKEDMVNTIREREKKDKLMSLPPQMGVYFEKLDVDVKFMVNKFTAPGLAAGMRGYDHMLQYLARLQHSGKDNEMAKLLKPYATENYAGARSDSIPILDEGFPFECDLLGVNTPDRNEDIHFMLKTFTAYALAEGIRTRSELIQFCAQNHNNRNDEAVSSVLKPFEAECIMSKRYSDHQIDWTEPLEKKHRSLMRKVLTAVPRRIGLAHQKRSAVVLPICHAYGAPSIMFQVRAEGISFPGDVCFPGGKAEYERDTSILETGMNEMKEETSGLEDEKAIEAIAALRCSWEELQALTCGVWAITPVVGWIGNVEGSDLRPSPSEVAELFTVPLYYLLDDTL